MPVTVQAQRAGLLGQPVYDAAGNMVGLLGASGATLRTNGFAPATYIPLGDSRVANGAADTGNSIQDMLRSPFTSLQAMMNGRIVQLRNAGVSGNTSTQMLARIQTDVIAFAPGWCFMLGPVNDIINGVSLATSQANVRAMYGACTAAGIKFATGTIGAWTSINTGALRAAHAAYNRWIRAWCQVNGIPCADELPATASASTSLPLTNTTYDTNHYSDYGASLAARAWYAALDPVIPSNQFLTGLAYDYDNLIWDGNGGWTVGASLPTGWTASNSNAGVPINTTVARTQDWVQGSLMQCVGTAAAQAATMGVTKSAADSISAVWPTSSAVSLGARRIANDGNQYVVTTAGTTGASQPAWNSTIGATTTDNTVTWTRYENFNVGDTCYAEAEYFVTGVSGGTLGFCPQLIMQWQGVAQNITVRGVTDQATQVPQDYTGKGVLRSRNFVIAAGATGVIPFVRAQMDNGVTGTIQIGRVAIKHAITSP